MGIRILIIGFLICISGLFTNVSAKGSLGNLTDDIISTYGNSGISSGNDTIEANRKLINLLRKREKEVIKLFNEGEANEIASNQIPSEIVERLPSSIKKHVEREEIVEGDLDLIFKDTRKRKNSSTGKLLISDDEVYRAYSAKDLDLADEENLQLKGFHLGPRFLIGSVENTDMLRKKSKTSSHKVLGKEKLLVALIKGNGFNNPDFTKRETEERIFKSEDSASNFIKRSSYGKFELSGEVTEWLAANNICSGVNGGYREYYKAANKLIQRIAKDYDFSDYSNVMFVAPSAKCFPGSLKGYGSIGKATFKIGKKKHQIAFSFVPSITSTQKFIEHELGHNLGSLHANSLYCGEEHIGTSTKCAKREYGDVFSVMGNENMQEFDSRRKEQFGWLDASEIRELTSPFDGEIEMVPVDSQMKGIKLVKIFTGNGIYYLEAPKKQDFQSEESFRRIGGALIRYVIGSSQQVKETYLVDSSPGSINGASRDFYDATLTQNNIFEDEKNHLSILAKQVLSSGITLDISI